MSRGQLKTKGALEGRWKTKGVIGGELKKMFHGNLHRVIGASEITSDVCLYENHCDRAISVVFTRPEYASLMHAL